MADTPPTITPLASVAYGDAYFAARLHTTAWFDSTSDQKLAALVQSTAAFNRLQFQGRKYQCDQVNEWPRLIAGQPIPCMPTDIQDACCENAIRLLDGFDIEIERRDMNVTARGYSSVRTSYNTNFPSAYIAAGISSSVAWDLLMPWFNDFGVIGVKRV